ncbi:methionine--tRNA ligase [Gloeocapsopsis sp. IPPAS B-1203]|nr:methionine--tRNA ligase [Gloeocapsopsis sp. IPPAS B-1203]
MNTLQETALMITFDEFNKLDIRIGTVLSATKVAGTDKLLHLEIDIGSKTLSIVTGMAEYIEPKYFIGKQVPIVVNLAPRKLRGIESQGMLLAIDVDGHPVLLHPEHNVLPGSIVR